MGFRNIQTSRILRGEGFVEIVYSKVGDTNVLIPIAARTTKLDTMGNIFEISMLSTALSKYFTQKIIFKAVFK